MEFVVNKNRFYGQIDSSQGGRDLAADCHGGIDIFVQVAIDVAGGMADLSGTKIESCDRKSLMEIAAELKEKSEKIRRQDDPQFQKALKILRWIPTWLMPVILRILSFLVFTIGISSSRFGLPKDPFGSLMVTSVGSLGISSAFVPFFPIGHVPIIICVGEVRPRPWIVDGRVEARPVLDLSVTFDHRFLDGLTAARMQKQLEEIFREPKRFFGSSE